MPKKLLKAGEKPSSDGDDISFLVDGDGGGGAFGENTSGFVFPKNLKDMTEAQKQALHEEYMQYMESSTASWKTGVDDYVELNPSEVLDPESPKPKPKAPSGHGMFSDLPDPKLVEAQLKEGPLKWTPDAGFIVDGEDLASIGRPIDIGSIPQGGAARAVGAEEARRIVDRARRKSMTKAQLDAEDRFGNL